MLLRASKGLWYIMNMNLDFETGVYTVVIHNSPRPTIKEEFLDCNSADEFYGCKQEELDEYERMIASDEEWYGTGRLRR